MTDNGPCLPPVLGLIIGAIFVQFAGWPWVFWFVALIAVPIGCVCVWLLPSPHREVDKRPTKGRWRTLDLGGVSILTGTSALAYFDVHYLTCCIQCLLSCLSLP